MTLNEPFLILISPSVADLGQAKVIADSVNQASSGYNNLQQQCDFLQKLALQDDTAVCIGVKRPVTQWSISRRDSWEWLICSHLPKNRENTDVIRSVLRELLSQVYEVKDETSAAWLKKAKQKQGSVYQASRMTELTQAFRSHPQLKDILWQPIPGPPNRTPITLNKIKMRTLFGLAIVVGLVVWLIAANRENKGTKGEVVMTTPSQDEKIWGEWHDLLSGDDRWKIFLNQTGGIEAYQAWEVAKSELVKNDDQGIGAKIRAMAEKMSPSPATSKPLNPQQKEAIKKLTEWIIVYRLEFNLPDATPRSLGNDGMTEYLKKASSPWYRNEDDQISKLKSELSVLKNASKELDEFELIFGKSVPPDDPKRLRAIWKAIDTFSKLEPNEKTKDFHKVVKRELKDMPAPPEDYSLLTLKDVEKMKRMKSIFGCEEFGWVAARSLFKEEKNWGAIKERIDEAVAIRMERRTSPEQALLGNLKIAFGVAGAQQPAPSNSQ